MATSYLDFLRNDSLQIALQSLVHTPSLFLQDLTKIESIQRPLFLKYLFKVENSQVYSYSRNVKINHREEDEEEYSTRLSIASWITSTYKFIFGFASFPAIIWKRTVPTYFNPYFEVTVFPSGEFYSLITFGTKNIIKELNGMTQEEIFEELNLRKKRGKIKKGRLFLPRINEMESGEVVFFVSSAFVTLPSTSRDLFLYTRQTIFDEISIHS
jgi:hypothetical protein